MGTFHHDKHELHGITVVVDTTGSEVYVGRCDDMDARQVILLDADVHRDGDDGKSKDDWVGKAALYGVFPKHRRLVIAAEQVASVRRLGDVGA